MAGCKEKLQKLQALLSHQLPYATKEELLHLALDEALEKRVKKRSDIGADVRSPQKRHIPEKLKAAIFVRDQGKCTYQDPVTGRKYESGHWLEFDHKLPLPLGGKTQAGNLRLLCRTHNNFAANQAGFTRSASYPL